MFKRRQFLKTSIGFIGAMGAFFGPFSSAIRWVYANTKKIILPKGTRKESLIGEDPKLVDARNLEVTNLNDFDTMGATGYQIDLKEWRLEVGGLVKQPLKLTYGDDWVKYVDKISFEKS